MPELAVSKGALSWLIFCLLLVIAWHIPHTPVWALVGVLAVAAWRYRMISRGNPLPAKGVKFLLTAAAFLGILFTYRSFLGRDPGMTFLILLATLKLLELKTQRDFMFVVFLCYFLVLGNFLFTQSIPSLAFMAVAVVLITVAILRLNHQHHETVKSSFLIKSALKLFFFALPLMVVLFFLFPRTSGPLWNLPHDPGGQARSGFNDYMYPGQIARLANSTNPAFRVMFPDKNMPSAKDLYFRGVVMWFTNGRGWYQGLMSASAFRRKEQVDVRGRGVRQEILLEPHFRRWLFALDMPAIFPFWARGLPGRIFRTNRVVERYLRYQVVSLLDYESSEPLRDTYRRWALQLPEDFSQRIRNLARSFGDRASSVEEIVQRVLDYFRDNAFVYTFEPGVMDHREPFEDFLFNKRKGFCEHFAGAFVLLMRAAGVPARVVAGYQGGKYNPVGEYLLVRQSEAHAWAEVWLEGRGWQRVDPTAVVSPERIEYGIDLSRTLESEAASLGDSRSDAIRRALQKGFLERLFETLEQYWDNINNKWNLWIMSYDLYQQQNFLESLGLQDASWLTLILVTAVLVFVLYFSISYLLKRKAASSQPLLELYRQFCQKLARFDLRRFPWEGPLDFESRAVKAFPESIAQIRQVTRLFIQLRYGRMPVTPNRIRELKKHIRSLRLG